MGLFSDIANVFEAPGKRKAASSAAAWQQAGLNDYINEIRGTQNANDEMFQPFVQSGQKAVGAQDDLVGINGNDAQDAAITGLQGSPLFESLMRNGQNTILANGAATGGIRGGNIQGSLANFGRDTLSGVIQQQLANLGGLSSQGLGAINTQTAQDNSTADTIGNLRSGIAQSKGGLALAKNAITNQQYSGIAGLLGDAVGAIFGVPGLGGSGSAGSDPMAALMSMFTGGQMLGGPNNSLGGVRGIGAGTGLQPVDVATSGGDPIVSSIGDAQRAMGGGVSNSIAQSLQDLSF